MTIREVKACNCVNVKRFDIVVNCKVQFLIFPQNLKYLNTFLVFLIIDIRFDFSRSGDLLYHNKICKNNQHNPQVKEDKRLLGWTVYNIQKSVKNYSRGPTVRAPNLDTRILVSILNPVNDTIFCINFQY